MKTALVTTTINVPTVLHSYRKLDPDVRFFVALDRKQAEGFADFQVSNTVFLQPEDQEHWECSPLLGWNTIGRRSIAILEALKWGANIIVTIDDDNLALSPSYFAQFRWALARGFNGIGVGAVATASRARAGWFDPGCLLVPPARHRGFPLEQKQSWVARSVIDATVGVAAGLCLGDPDISATTRMEHAPEIHGISELARPGVVVEPGTWTVFNSQNTAFSRELAPCFLMVPQWGRYDDIWSGLIAQKIMRDRGLHVHLGAPLVWQQRNPHSLVKDLEAELLGMKYTERFADLLDAVPLVGGSVLGDLQTLWGVIRQPDWMPDGIGALASAWLVDCGKVL